MTFVEGIVMRQGQPGLAHPGLCRYTASGRACGTSHACASKYPTTWRWTISCSSLPTPSHPSMPTKVRLRCPRVCNILQTKVQSQYVLRGARAHTQPCVYDCRSSSLEKAFSKEGAQFLLACKNTVNEESMHGIAQTEPPFARF